MSKTIVYPDVDRVEPKDVIELDHSNDLFIPIEGKVGVIYTHGKISFYHEALVTGHEKTKHGSKRFFDTRLDAGESDRMVLGRKAWIVRHLPERR